MTGRCVRMIVAALTAVALAAAPASAQDDMQGIYASIEDAIRAEFGAMMADVAVQPPSKIERAAESAKLIAYNKAALFAHCAVEAKKGSLSGDRNFRPEQNLMLRTCIDVGFEQLRRHMGLIEYVGIFIPERVEPCERKARLADREAALPPYAFLRLEKPRLYDFASFNECLMPRD